MTYIILVVIKRWAKADPGGKAPQGICFCAKRVKGI